MQNSSRLIRNTLLITGVTLAITATASAFSPGEKTLASKGFNPARQAEVLSSPSFLQGRAPAGNVAFDTDTGHLWSVSGTLTSARDGSPEKAARDFIDKSGSLLGTGDMNMVAGEGVKISETLVKTTEAASGNRTHIRFDQVLSGMVVIGAGAIVHLDARNRVRAAEGTLFPVSSGSGTLSASDAAARNLALGNLKVSSLRGTVATDHVLLPTESGLVSVYRVQIPAREPLGDFTVYVNADASKVLAADNALCFVQGTTRVYPTHPLNSSLENRVVMDLSGDGTKLTGPYCTAKNDDGDAAVAADKKFVYEPEDTHFDEAMVYYHLENIHRYYKVGLGFNKMDWSIPATVHYGDKYDNAFFSPMSKTLAFGDGNRLNDLSKEADVVYHEYTHAVSNEMARLSWGEAGAMNEGYSDYFGCTITEDPKIGVWAMQRTGRPWMRNLTSTKHYPEDLNGEVHADGEIWASACWDLRKEFGRDVADKIVHESRNYLGSSPNFKKGFKACLEADKALFNEAHKAKITAVFEARGITLPSATENQQILNRLLIFSKM